MPLVWTKGVRPTWFVPDCLENIRHDAPDDASMTVYTADGVAVFGRVIHGSEKRWAAVLDDGWKYV